MDKPKRVSKILTRDWPSDHSERIQTLRELAGRLPLYDRYVAGEFRQAWADLEAQREAVWYDPLAGDALAVAFETTHRARMNVGTLVTRLEEAGYEFCSTAFSPYWRTSDADSAMADMNERVETEMIEALQMPRILPPELECQREQLAIRDRWSIDNAMARATYARERRMGIVRPTMAPHNATATWIKRVAGRAGQIPLSLRAWHIGSGGVNLVGCHPEIAPAGVECDPLFVAPFQFVLDLCQAWEEEGADVEYPPPFQMPISPHRTAKARGDVGAPLYAVTLPATGIDAVIENEGHDLSFVDYLRLAFKWGGFPGYARMPAKAPKLIASLREGLLPI